MRASINLEFSDDELRKYAEDVGRRWVLTFIHEVMAHLSGVNFDPSWVTALQDMISSGPSKTNIPPAPATAAIHPFCIPVRETDQVKPGWLCHSCGRFNGNIYSVCLDPNCGHVRCDTSVSDGQDPFTPTDPPT